MKKKTQIKDEDIDQVAKIMKDIFNQKINVPHNSLLNGD
jgi:hypothetical protein